MLQTLSSPYAFAVYFLLLQAGLGLATAKLPKGSKLQTAAEFAHAALPMAFAHMPFAGALAMVPAWVKDLLARLSMSTLVGVVALSLMTGPLAGCKSLTPQQISTIETTATNAGCTVVAVMDQNSGQALAAVCEAIAPTVRDVIVAELQKLFASKGALSLDERFVAVTYKGQGAGVVRAEVAKAVQAKLDAMSAQK